MFLVACSSSDDGNSVPDNGNGDGEGNEEVLISYVDKITNISQNGSTELRFTYDGDNNLIKNETDSYVRDYTYVSNKITKIVSTTLPATLYYTIDFLYEGNRVVAVERNNHYNSSIFYVTYEYDANERVSKVCTYSNIDDYNLGECNRFYEISYLGNSKNYAQKDLIVNSINGSEFLEISNWTYDDSGERPYFGDALEKIRLPYATDGTGMDYEFIYNTNNPLTKHIFDFNTNESKLRRSYTYQYTEGQVMQMVIDTYNTLTGQQTGTFTQNFDYILK